MGRGPQCEGLNDDPSIVVINEDGDVGAFDEWRVILADDEPSDMDAGAVEILRAIRQHGER